MRFLGFEFRWWWRDKKIISDLEILREINSSYYDVFCKYVGEVEKKDADERETKIYIPIDCKAIADKFNVDRDIVFGRLYYYLDYKYSYKRNNGVLVPFFYPRLGKDRNVINYALLSSILADLENENKKASITTFIAISSLLVSALALYLNQG